KQDLVRREDAQSDHISRWPRRCWTQGEEERDEHPGRGRDTRNTPEPRPARTCANGRHRGSTVSDPFQLVQQVAGGLPTVIGILVQTLLDDPIKERRQE